MPIVSFKVGLGLVLQEWPMRLLYILKGVAEKDAQNEFGQRSFERHVCNGDVENVCSSWERGSRSINTFPAFQLRRSSIHQRF